MAYVRDIRAGRATVELTTKDRLERGLARARARLLAFGREVRSLGSGMLTAGVGVLAPLGLAAKAFADFERQMANVATMLDRPAEHMERFKRGIRDMAAEFGESTEALAGGLYDILSASVEPAKALKVLGAAVKAAKAGMTDTKTAADALTTVLNAYGLSADEVGRVSDVLFNVVKRGKTTFAELAPTVGLVASTAASAGVSLEEFGAALATMTRNGVRTENAVTALNAILSTFMKPSKEAADLARRLGFEMSAATLKTEGLAGVFQRIASLNPNQIAQLFPNVRAIRGVMPALRDLRGFLDDVQRMGRTGATEEAYRKMAGTLSHAFNQIKQAAVVAAGEIGEALAGSIQNLVQRVRQWLDEAVAWVRQNRELIGQYAEMALKIGAWVAGIGAALVAVGKLATALGTLIGVVKGLAAAWAFLKAGTLAGPITAAVGVVGLLAVALDRWATAHARVTDEARRWRREQDAQRAADLDRLRRLQALAEKERLNQQEMQEAEGLARALRERYGDLGITVDRTTGAITGLAEAQRHLTDAMRQARIIELTRELDEYRRNIAELRKEQEDLRWKWFGISPTGRTIEAVGAEIEDQLRRFGETKRLLERLQEPGPAGPDALTGRPGPSGRPGTAGGGEATAQPTETALELEERLARLRAEAIADAHQRELQLIRLRYQAEERRLRERGATEEELAKLREARDLEIHNANMRYLREEQEARERALREELSARMDALDRSTAYEENLQRQIEEAQADLIEDDQERARRRLEIEYKYALREAALAGANLDKVRELFALRRKLLQQRLEAPESAMRVRGTFGGGAVRGLIEGTRLAERTAQATEQTAKNTEAMRRQLQCGTLVFTG